MDAIEKNILDLQHSLSQSKATLFFNLGIGSGIAIFFGSIQLEILPIKSFIIALLFSLLFINKSIKYFSRCSKIQNYIYKKQNKN
ncbi:hypothetical protein CMI37_17465 [Candidatus Pacearchaeota archaeon]|nr:hypothetical protein [Candidatus Pacearchaeota archaeon]|tara:strand:+ start:1916 stop:2170 length:255 start_codon:yes stop_codon:yes gene_type:complete